MKKIYLLSLLLSIVFLSFAQNSTRSSTLKKPKIKEYVFPPNVLKLNLSGLLFKTVGLQFEHKLAKNMSFALGMKFRPTSKILMYEMYGQNPAAYHLTQEVGYMYNTAKYGIFSFTPELRLYLKKHAPKGLYLAPFLHYQMESTKFNFTYSESNTSITYNKVGNGTMTDSKMGVGLLFGYQILKSNKLAIDFWFLGPWVGQNTNKLVSKINMTNVTAYDKSMAASNLETFFHQQAVNWDNSGINSSYKKYTGGLRMLGVNIGYNF